METFRTWRNGNQEVTMDASREEIICTFLTDNPHESTENYVSFADFLSDAKLTSLYIKSYFSPEIYTEMLDEVKKRSQV